LVGFELFGFWLVGFGLFGIWLVTMAYEVPLRVTSMDVKHRNEWNRVTTLKLLYQIGVNVFLEQLHAEYQEQGLA